MAKIEFKGIDAYIKKLSTLENRSEPILKKAVFDGVGVCADAIRGAIESLPSAPRRPGPSGVADYEKQAMLAGLGTSSIENDSGFVNGKIGFHGYYEHNGREIPIPMIARAVESGTSFMTKNPVISKTARATKAKVIAEMDNTVYAEIEKIMK